MVRQILLTLVLSVGIALYGCSSNSSVAKGGGDDFPNSILGKRMNDELSRSWSNPVAIDDSVPAFIGSIDMQLSNSLSKTTATLFSIDSLFIDYSDTPNGLVRICRTLYTDSTVGHDTTNILYSKLPAETLIVSITSTVVHTRMPFRVEVVNYEDYDGDGILLGNSTGKMQGKTTSIIKSLGGLTLEQMMVVDAGPDRNFTTERDNKIVTGSSLILRDKDTVNVYIVSDADGDGFVSDNESIVDSSIVNLNAIVGYNLKKPLVARQSLRSRMVIFRSDPVKNYPVQYWAEEKMISGREVQGWIKKNDGDSIFHSNDTVKVYVITRPAIYDSLLADTAIMKVKLGNLPNDSIDDCLIGIYSRTQKRSGIEHESIFSFTSDIPISAGKKPENGILYFKIIYESGKWAEVNGLLTKAQISADYKDSDENTFRVVWDRNGNLISKSQ